MGNNSLKICSKCKVPKESVEFNKDKGAPDGLYRHCRGCQHLYYLANKEGFLKRVKLYQLTHPEKVIEYRLKYNGGSNGKEKKAAYMKIWGVGYRLTHKQKINKRMGEYHKNRYAKDLQYRLRVILRSRLNDSLKKKTKVGSFVRDLGCTIPELISYLEEKFQNGMAWENHSISGWHIDHKIPLDFYDLTNRQQFLQACHYTNLQPMWAEENIRKHNKIL